MRKLIQMAPSRGQNYRGEKTISESHIFFSMERHQISIFHFINALFCMLNHYIKSHLKLVFES